MCMKSKHVVLATCLTYQLAVLGTRTFKLTIVQLAGFHVLHIGRTHCTLAQGNDGPAPNSAFTRHLDSMPRQKSTSCSERNTGEMGTDTKGRNTKSTDTKRRYGRDEN